MRTTNLTPAELLARLAQAESRAQAAEAAVQDAARCRDEFLSMLAHELRNPLVPIRNALQILCLRGDDVQVRDWSCAVLTRQVGYLAHIVSDLLEVSRLTRGRVRLRPERIDLKAVIGAAVEDHRPAVEEAGLTLVVELPAEPLWMKADATRIAQVMDNLLSNALKFTPPGGEIRVRLAPEEREGRAGAQVSVSDTGCGIEPSVMPSLFDALTQADRSLDRTKGGLGLGLALVKGLVELHQGQVAAHSPGLGQGAVFSFWLPVAGGAVASGTSSSGEMPALLRPRVLIVEDNIDAAETLRLLLSETGFEVAVAHTGTAAVTEAGRFRPDVVLCDLGLPELDGYGVARALRADPQTARARLIAVTGYGREEDRRRSREAGFDLHLTKPVAPEELRSVLVATTTG